ncbi:18380_t:CDS:2, partial [Racocetra persica]
KSFKKQSRMDLSEYLICIVCREIKDKPLVSQCCNRIFCSDCVQRLKKKKLRGGAISEDTFNFHYPFARRLCRPSSLKFGNSLGNPPDSDSSDVFKISILTLKDKRITIDVNKNYRVRDVKKKIREIEGFEPRLIHLGKQLEDYRYISYYNIKKDSVVHLVKRYN